MFLSFCFLSKGADFNDFKFADVMNNTYNVANKLVFPLSTVATWEDSITFGIFQYLEV